MEWRLFWIQIFFGFMGFFAFTVSLLLPLELRCVVQVNLACVKAEQFRCLALGCKTGPAVLDVHRSHDAYCLHNWIDCNYFTWMAYMLFCMCEIQMVDAFQLFQIHLYWTVAMNGTSWESWAELAFFAILKMRYPRCRDCRPAHHCRVLGSSHQVHVLWQICPELPGCDVIWGSSRSSWRGHLTVWKAWISAQSNHDKRKTWIHSALDVFLLKRNQLGLRQGCFDAWPSAFRCSTWTPRNASWWKEKRRFEAGMVQGF